MLKTVNKVAYKAFGLKVLSDIPLPELPLHTGNSEELAEIFIEKDDLSELWFELSSSQQRFVIKRNLVLFEIEDIAIFLIQNGKKIVISPLSEYEEDIIRLYVLGTCMGALLMQRKVLPLHGSAIAIDGKAYVFIGDSGAGKSTLATAFLNRGYQLLTDDVIAISLSEHNIPYVTPAYPQQKLWRESLIEFGMNMDEYRSIYGRETKFCVPVHTQYFVEALPLAGVFELVKTENEKVDIHPIEGLERFRTLSYHTYRNFLIRDLGLMDWHFTISASMLNLIDVYQICRPISTFSAPQLTDLVLEIINREE
ncbi:aldolase [Bacillus sp. JJ634]